VIDKPQFAFVGEKEREYIIPESKMGGTSSRKSTSDAKNVYYIHVEGVKSEDVVKEVIRKLRMRDILS
jgi:hypothetical protein